MATSLSEASHAPSKIYRDSLELADLPGHEGKVTSDDKKFLSLMKVKRVEMEIIAAIFQ